MHLDVGIQREHVQEVIGVGVAQQARLDAEVQGRRRAARGIEEKGVAEPSSERGKESRGPGGRSMPRPSRMRAPLSHSDWRCEVRRRSRSRTIVGPCL